MPVHPPKSLCDFRTQSARLPGTRVEGFVDVNSGYGQCGEQVRNGVDENCDRRAGEGDQSARDERTGGWAIASL